jgi:hypothetical protein
LGTVVVSYEYGDESSYSTKDQEFFDQLGDYRVLKKDLGAPFLGACRWTDICSLPGVSERHEN